jgi:ferredoxin
MDGFPSIHDSRVSIHEEVIVADPNDRVGENVTGTYYVDTQCIDCDVCRDTAPDNFTRSDENGYSFVYKQPETQEENALCEEALAACPVEAIGNDG